MYKYAEIEYAGIKLDVTIIVDNEGLIAIKHIYLSGTKDVDLLNMFSGLFDVCLDSVIEKIASLALGVAHF